MQIFERDGKLNFVDENNNFIGFDYRQKCCENFGYFIKYDKIEDILYEKGDDTSIFQSDVSEYTLHGYIFGNSKVITLSFGDEMYAHKIQLVEIELINDDLKRYLYIYNDHNGYYAHGIEIKDSDNNVVIEYEL